MMCPKSNENGFLCSAEGQERKVGVEAGGGGTQVCSLTFLSWVRAFVAVGKLAKCVVVFMSCHGRKCRGVCSGVTRLISARNSENLVPKRCSCWGQLMGMLFVFSPSLQLAQGVQGRKGERWGRTARRASSNFKNWEQCSSCEGCSG